MIDDYFLLGLVFFFAIGLVFFMLGLNDEKIWRKIIYHILSCLGCVETGLLFIVANEDWGQAFQWMFYFMGLINFVLIIFHSVQSLDVSKRERWEV